MKDNCIRWYISFLIVALLTSLIMHSATITRESREFFSTSEKVPLLISGPRTDVGDNYYYFSLLKFFGDAHKVDPRLDTDGGNYELTNPLTKTYAVALYAGHVLYSITSRIVPNSRIALLTFSIAVSTILVLSFLFFINTVLAERIKITTPIMLFGAMTLLFIDVFSYSSLNGKFSLHYLGSLSPNIVRLVSPTFNWSIGLISAAFLIRWIRFKKRRDFFLACACCFVSSLFSLAIGAVLLLSLLLYFLSDSYQKKCISSLVFYLMVASLIGFMFALSQILVYQDTAVGSSLQHGKMLEIQISWHFLIFFLFLPLLILIFDEERYYLACLISAAIIIGMLSQSVHLGSRLWVRGGAIFPFAFFVVGLIWTVDSCNNFFLKTKKNYLTSLLTILILCLSLTWMYYQHPQKDSWRGFIKKDKWSLYRWIDKNVKGNKIIASSDIGDAFLLPIYTTQRPLYAMYGLSPRSFEDNINRFFYNMNLYGLKEKWQKNIFTFNKSDLDKQNQHLSGEILAPTAGLKQDIAIFMNLVIYYRFQERYANLFQNDQLRQNFNKEISEYANRKSSYKVDYIIISKKETLPNRFSKWQMLYQNSNYSLFANPKG